MKLAIAAAVAAVATAQRPSRDFVAFVSNTGATGQLGYYLGGNAVYRVVSCNDDLTDITSVNNDTLVFSSTTQIYVRAVNDTSTSTCGRAVLTTALTGGRIAHIATDGNWIFFTDTVGKSVRRVAFAGGVSAVIVANTADGSDGRRLGVGVWGNQLYYSFQGINITTGYMRNCLFRANLDGTAPAWQACYGNTTTWWYSDLQISRTGGIFVSEFRNSSTSNPPPTNNIQANQLPTTGSWTLLMSGLTPADEENTFLALDEAQNVIWYTASGTNQILASSSINRQTQPQGLTLVTVPSAFGTVHGIVFIPSSSAADSARFVYTTPSATVSAFPSPGSGFDSSALPTPSTSGSPGASPAGASPSPRAGGGAAAAGITSVVAVAAAAVAVLAARRHE